MTVDDLLSRLEGTRSRGTGRWTARCPAHDDNTPSLSVSEGERGVLLRCFAGCSVEEITRTMGLEMRDLFYDTDPDPAAPYRARVQRQAEKRKQATERQLTGLDVDCRREAQRFIENARGLDISSWTEAQLDRALEDLSAAHRTLQAEGPAYYEFVAKL